MLANAFSNPSLAISVRRPTRARLQVRQPAWCTGMTVRVNGRRSSARAAANGYVAIDREWRDGDRVEISLPMSLRTELLPGTSDTVAFVYGPVVLAGRLGRDGLTPGSQIIVNERESGTMLRADVDIPVLAGDVATLAKRLRQDPRAPLTFHMVDPGRPRDVELAPYFQLAHERYTIYWKVQ